MRSSRRNLCGFETETHSLIRITEPLLTEPLLLLLFFNSDVLKVKLGKLFRKFTRSSPKILAEH